MVTTMIENTSLPDCKLITPNVHKDNRGYFLETFRQNDYLKILNFNLVQINESFSYYGVIRGLHAQIEPFAQTKIIQVLSGKILDAVVDIRPNSITFGKTMTILMNERQKQQLLIPEGFLHGYAVLSECATIQYYVNAPYSPSHEIGVRYDDPQLNINWMILPSERHVSDKDLALPTYQQLISQIT
ncbi:MAG: dTDP-4-dehydrorhamnose 3,5-epimerase [Neisseriaceae bacterium]|nr:MAG: dTDP-4-dehydrorhamnose 3,5-epimerase [Neisseriaceae bacterium]